MSSTVFSFSLATVRGMLCRKLSLADTSVFVAQWRGIPGVDMQSYFDIRVVSKITDDACCRAIRQYRVVDEVSHFRVKFIACILKCL